MVTPLRALVLNCTLKPSPHSSSAEQLARETATTTSILAANAAHLAGLLRDRNYPGPG